MIESLKVLLLGLDNSGKTSILYQLKLDEYITSIPTIGFNVETIEYKKKEITIWDVGGKDKLRPLWIHYLDGTDALIYAIDGNDRNRIEEAKIELFKILQNEKMKNLKLLILANKQVRINEYLRSMKALNIFKYIHIK